MIQTAFIGDLILSIPLFKRIREKKPHAPLFVVTRRGLGQFLKDLKIIDGFFEIDKGSGRSYGELAEKLSSVRFDWIVCPHQSVRTALFVWRLQADVKMGFMEWWNGIVFTDRTEKNPALPDPLRQLSLLRPVDLELANLFRSAKFEPLNEPGKDGMLPALSPWMELGHRERILEWADPFMLKAPYVCIFPGSVWATKRWTEQGFAELGNTLMRQGNRVVWMGAKDEIALCASLEKQVPGSQSLAGKTSLTHTLSVLARANAVVSNDSGGQHLATLAGVPVVSIFGPTVLSLGFRPWTSQGAIVERIGLQCRPCGKHGHKKCPIGTHECMKSVGAQRVYDALVALTTKNAT